MKYALYPLQFDTPVHFGCAENGGKLEQSSLTYRADSLFGALCYELSLQGDETGLLHLQEGVAKGKLLFSDLFPYIHDEMEGLQLYVPKPILTISSDERRVTADYDTFRQQATQQKRQKKLSYIQVSQLADFIQAMKSGKAFDGTEPFLYRGLTLTGASRYMCLSVLLPSPAEVADVQKGQFALCRRSGFLSPDGSRMQKKNDIYMIQAGSCFPEKIAGCMTDVGGQGMTHPVWRYGKGLYVGLML